MEKTTQEGGHFFGKKSVIRKIKTVFIDFFGYVKEWPYDARILHFLDPFFVNVAGVMALGRYLQHP